MVKVQATSNASQARPSPRLHMQRPPAGAWRMVWVWVLQVGLKLELVGG